MQEKDAGLKWVHEEVERVKGLFEHKEQRLAGKAANAEAAAADASAAASSAEHGCKELEGRLATVSAAHEACRPQPAHLRFDVARGATCSDERIFCCITARHPRPTDDRCRGGWRVSRGSWM